MKNDKICISKAVAFMIPVVLVIIAIILFTSYLNNQTYSTKSKAAAPKMAVAVPRQMCLYQGKEVGGLEGRGRGVFVDAYAYNIKTFCVLYLTTLHVSQPNEAYVEQALPYRCKSQMEYTASGMPIQTLVSGEALMDAQCLGTAKTCMFGGATILPGQETKVGTQVFSIDPQGCYVQDNKKNGWRCRMESTFAAKADYMNVKDATCIN